MNNSNPLYSRQGTAQSSLDTVTKSSLRKEETAEKGVSVGAFFGVSGSRLGIVAKTSSPFDFIDKNTGEIYQMEPEPLRSVKGEIVLSEGDTQRVSRAARWELKSAVNRLLPNSNTSKCMVWRKPIPGQGLSDIHVCRGQDTKKAFYHGLMSCGSVWNCPVCSAKISERRRIELKEALEVAKKKDYAIHFVTLTFPHGISDDLQDILPKMTKAYGKLSNGKYSVKSQLKKFHPDAKIHGFIRAVEVTHGQHGFHPHVHMIVFTDRETGSSFLEYIYGKAWQRACRLVGLPIPSNEHGCTVKDGSYAAEYASKWGLEEEMTKANSKQTRTKGVTPWGLLRCIVDGDDPEYTPERASGLFRAYSKAFTGKRQLYWSNGLRKLLSADKEVSDEELAERPDDERASILSTITPEQWKIIRRNKHQSALLDLAEKRPDLVASYIEQLDDSVTDSSEDIIQPEQFQDRSQIISPVEDRTEQGIQNLIDYKKLGYFDYYESTKARGGAEPEHPTIAAGVSKISLDYVT